MNNSTQASDNIRGFIAKHSNELTEKERDDLGDILSAAIDQEREMQSMQRKIDWYKDDLHGA